MNKLNSVISISDWRLPGNVRAAYTTRGHDPNRLPYGRFNLATHVGDHPNQVLKNRRQLSGELELPAEPLWLNQIHGSHCVINRADQNQTTADASYAHTAGVVCAILTADCLPILVCSSDGREIAAIHAGWRGLLNGVIQQTLSLFKAPPSALRVWLGPRISMPHYEVGKELIEKFSSADKSYEAAVQKVGPRYFFDLSALADIQLKRGGIDKIHDCGHCTFAQSEEFYSYRRDGETGRFASLIWRTN